MLHSHALRSCAIVMVASLLGQNALNKATAQTPVVKVQIVADEMCCHGCAQKVAAQLYAAPGVRSVEADVPSRVVTITAKRSPKLTLERLWSAVEKGKGSPSKLMTSQATYALKRSASLKPDQRATSGRYSLTVLTMTNKESAQQIANNLYAVRGVKGVSVDVAKRTLFVESAAKTILSPWNLAAAVESAHHEPTAILGPHGLLTIERPVSADSETAVRSTRPAQGEIR